jgi:hypothetical protein
MSSSNDIKAEYIQDILDKLGFVTGYYQNLNQMLKMTEEEAENYIEGIVKPLNGIDINRTRAYWREIRLIVESKPIIFSNILVGLYVDTIVEYYYKEVMKAKYSDWGSKASLKNDRGEELLKSLSKPYRNIYKDIIKPLRYMRNSFLHRRGRATENIIISVKRHKPVKFAKDQEIDFSRVAWDWLIRGVEDYLLRILDFGFPDCE